ncbi:hypothetical protein ACFX13_016815 [Malus domestica]|uniref:Uncharacterized protein n=1 Tax=Malus domestica TaxID=3750 RepID=A0A498HUZ6_MALDO|nr:hypothetical protein DVH24_012685 [Malus domestica]
MLWFMVEVEKLVRVMLLNGRELDTPSTSFSVLVKEKAMAVEGKRIFDDKRKRCTVPDADSCRRVLVEHLSVCRERMEVT